MAKIGKSILGKLSGSIGNTTIINSKYGTSLRQKTKPINRWSELKQNSKHNHFAATQLWSKITPYQHEVWLKLAETFVRIDKEGNEYAWRAYDLFRKINRNLIEINEPVTLDAPKKTYPKQFKSIDVEISASQKLENIRIFFKPAIPQNTKFIIYASPQMAYGRFSTKKSFYRKIAVIDSTFHSGYSILNEYMSAYKDSPYGTFKIAFRFRPVSKISGLDADKVSFIRMPS